MVTPPPETYREQTIMVHAKTSYYYFFMDLLLARLTIQTQVVLMFTKQCPGQCPPWPCVHVYKYAFCERLLRQFSSLPHSLPTKNTGEPGVFLDVDTSKLQNVVRCKTSMKSITKEHVALWLGAVLQKDDFFSDCPTLGQHNFSPKT